MSVSEKYGKKKTLSLSEDVLLKNLRLLNNNDKRVLIETYVNKGNYVQDNSIGKGGDLDKYDYPGTRLLIGYDIDPVSINEARSRYQKGFKRGLRPYVYEAVFRIQDLTKMINQTDTKIDVSISMFAIHYAFGDETSLDNYVYNMIIGNPKTVIIITTNDTNILKYLKGNKKNKILHIKPINIDNDIYGREIDFNLGTKWSDEGIQEYLVDSDTLISKFNLKSYSLHDKYNLSDNLDSNVSFDLKETRSIYDAYVFKLNM